MEGAMRAEKLELEIEKLQQISDMRGKMDEIEKEKLKMEHRAEMLTWAKLVVDYPAICIYGTFL